ncbi:MAG: glycosyltransferase family 2 protein [Acidobacteria bacterium]|nr:glycosyltransferase family 2 protein [Acidobacteriota bacterium]MBI3656475.1 glycosyltransferase family 2 protein [Acidobacteriota bacterium]
MISVFMPVYNGERYIGEAIQSIVNQTYTEFELLIVDDASTDGTVGIISQWVRKDRRIRAFYLPHVGAVHARNFALNQVNQRHRYLMNHDSDDISFPDKFRTLVEFLESHPSIAVVGCFADYIDAQGHFLRELKLITQPEEFRQNYHVVNSLINSAALIRRTVFAAVGNYRDEYNSVDDYDFFARTLMAGFDLANVPQKLHKIRLHPQSMGSTRLQLQERLAEKVREKLRNYARAAAVLA